MLMPVFPAPITKRMCVYTLYFIVFLEKLCPHRYLYNTLLCFLPNWDQLKLKFYERMLYSFVFYFLCSKSLTYTFMYTTQICTTSHLITLGCNR